jgi:death-on-curing protein
VGQNGYSLRFPTREDIIRLNRRHLERSGEEYFLPDNMVNPGSLDWVLDVIKYPVFGVDLYPTLAKKAARLAWTIIVGHVFWEGNHRTGMAALEIFLGTNGHRLAATDDEMEEVGYRLDSTDPNECLSCEGFAEWIDNKVVPVRPRGQVYDLLNRQALSSL